MKLQVWIKANNLTQRAFHKRCLDATDKESGVSFHSVSKWCAGTRIPSLEHMRLINELTSGEVQANDFYGL